MTIVQKVCDLLGINGEMSLREIYDSLPEHTPASIRGNINRYLNKPDCELRRVDRGVYSVVQILKVDKLPDGKGSSVNYSVSYYSGDKLISYFHQDYQTSVAVKAGIYHRMDSFGSFEEMEAHNESLRGILAHANARDILPKLKSGYFDLMVTDPPYRVISGGNKGKGAPKGMLSKNDGRIFVHNDIAFSEWLPEAYRILKPGAQAYIFTNLLNLMPLWKEAEKSGFKVHNLLVWQKNNANPSRWYMSNREFILYLYKKGKGQPASIADCGCKAVHQFDNIAGDKLHETEKPVDLLQMYIRNSCSTGGWCIDPFAGSNSTMLACFLEGIRCFAVELDSKYIHRGIERAQDFLRTGIDLAHKSEKVMQLEFA